MYDQPSSICRGGPPWTKITAGFFAAPPEVNNCPWIVSPSAAMKVTFCGTTRLVAG